MMTEKELRDIIAEAQAELCTSYDQEKVKELLSNAHGADSVESLILGVFQLSLKMNQELLFKVLSKALCK